jgi:hypothetical protein
LHQERLKVLDTQTFERLFFDMCAGQAYRCFAEKLEKRIELAGPSPHRRLVRAPTNRPSVRQARRTRTGLSLEPRMYLRVKIAIMVVRGKRPAAAPRAVISLSHPFQYQL